MDRIVVNGGKRLSGDVCVGGSKNAALPILLGGIVTGDVCVFLNLPRVSDVLQTLEILKLLGARICFLPDGAVRVDYSTVTYSEVPAEMTGGIRGSTYLLGAMLARFGRAALRGSGGCDLGERPIDQHLLGFERLGAAVVCTQDGVFLEATGLHGASIALAMPSVGATANLLLAAVTAEGKTVIQNAAAEPHVDALIDFLISAGASISREDGCLCVLGVPRLRGVACRIIPDMIEAGTYLCMGMACGGTVRVRNVCPSHLEALLCCLRRMGARPECGKNYVTLTAPREYACTAVTTGPYPAFPTDLHPQIAALFALGNRATGEGSVRETVFATRFRYTEELRRMGADMRVTGDTVTVRPRILTPQKTAAPDLRGGAALLLAALATKGKSEITCAAQIGRGYEHLEQKLRALGARVAVY